ncbi:MAG: molybdopterin-dependent oxidoreductase [Euryarchaeota archaeon]|nr:molybdopterin-dependent oxidoreductase [Euryarchaeota archaeon]
MTRRTFVKAAATTGAATYVAMKMSEMPLLETVKAADGAPAPLTEEWVPTTCWIGKQECGMLARKINGRVVKLEGDPNNPRNVGKLCPKGIAQIQCLYDPNRIKTPLVRTNGKGVPGTFRSASWDEALTIVADRVKEARAKNKGIVWQKGRSKSETIYDDALTTALGTVKFGHGAYCSDAGYRACEYTIGPHGVLHPDFKHTRYVLSWGWNLTNGGGNKYCWITWNRQLVEAKDRGLKVVHIDPRERGAGPHADDWIPIRPGTDMAFGLALAHMIMAGGKIDREYLTKYTNATYLVGEDGLFLTKTVKVTKDGKETDVAKELVWDTATGTAVPFDAAGVTPALEGSYAIDGKNAKTGYELFKTHVEQYTPTWAASVCGVPEASIRQVAKDLVENAQIGSTIELEGVKLPYRPVSIMAYHMSQQEHGFGAIRIMLMVMMLLGAVEAVGGQRIDSTWKEYKNYEKLGHPKVKATGYNYALADSKYYPINSGNPGVIATVFKDPAKWGVDPATIPEVLLIHMANMSVSFASQPDIERMLGQYRFVAAIDPWMSRTADLFADVILPAATMEKYEGPNSGSDMYTDASVIRVPVTDPLFESKGEIDIYIDLCEKTGDLTGAKGFIAEMNRVLGLKDANALPTETKPTTRAVFDAWARQQGITEGVSFFEKNGVKVKGAVSAKKFYGFASSPPFKSALDPTKVIVHRFYGASLVETQHAMKTAFGSEAEANKLYWLDYTAFPTWRAPTMDSSPAKYAFTLVSYKKIEFKQGRASQVPLLAELAPEQMLEINTEAARSHGIGEGDWVWVESHNAVTGETRKIRVRAALRETIRPDVVGLPHHYGNVARHTGSVGQGPTANALFFTGPGYVGMTADQSFHVKVSVTKDIGGVA